MCGAWYVSIPSGLTDFEIEQLHYILMISGGNGMCEKCRFCKAELKTGSTFCTDCNHFQNWRRLLFFGTSTLSLLIALISVATVFYSSIRDTFFYTNIVRLTGSEELLKIYNFSEKPIVVKEYWKIERDNNGVDEYIRGMLKGGTFVINVMSEATFTMVDAEISKGRPFDSSTQGSKIILNSLSLVHQDKPDKNCSLIVGYDILGTEDDTSKVSCKLELTEIKQDG